MTRQPPSPPTGRPPAIHPVILCGGSGTRLWPTSRRSFPKQFSPLLGPESLFQTTLRRLSGPAFAPPLIVTHSDFRFLAAEQAASAGIAPAMLVLEPAPRNTGPAILAAAHLLADRPDDLMLIAPSDHDMTRPDAFIAAMLAGVASARDGRLVAFGIAPDSPATGYGWLELDAAPAPLAPAPVRRFVEKPGAAQAAAMLASGRHLWNAGIFLASVGTLIDAFSDLAPDLGEPVRAAVAARRNDLGFTRLGPAYADARAVSFDVAVMEKSGRVTTVPADPGWSDVGSWDAVRAAQGPDADGLVTTGHVTAIGTTRSLLRSEDDGIHLVAIGLTNVIAVATRDAVLIADMSAAQQVGEAVGALKAKAAPQAEASPRSHRPWGWFESLGAGPRFQVKRIMVRPGGRLSLQSHVHRAEHWVVVAGTARVTIGDDTRLVTENESVYVPLGARHRLENPGRVPLFLIEVQTGAYLAEDDITRLDDDYRREPGE